jgi:hypothetical protein
VILLVLLPHDLPCTLEFKYVFNSFPLSIELLAQLVVENELNMYLNRDVTMPESPKARAVIRSVSLVQLVGHHIIYVGGGFELQSLSILTVKFLANKLLDKKIIATYLH